MFRTRFWLRTLRKKRRNRMNNRMPNPRPRARVRVAGAVSRKRKLEQLTVDSDHGTIEKKRNTNGNNVVSDCISDLPDSIIHLIYSSLKCTKDVARTQILSQKWKNNFNSYLTFDFDERWFCEPKRAGMHNRIKAREIQKKKFKSYVERSLRTRLDPVPCIDKFRLYVNKIDKVLLACMERWVCSALTKNVKELDVQVDTKGKQYVLPDSVLMSPPITSLKLSGFIEFGSGNISLSNLRQLSIKDSIYATDAIIKEFETSCPLLEDLRLISCTKIICLSISSLVKLKRVEVHECVNAIFIKIASPRLESFLYQGDKNQGCEIDLKGSSNLRNLTLRCCNMTGTVFQSFISNFSLIEKLELQKCGNIERVIVLSDSLRSLTLVQCTKLEQVTIDAPTLYNLEFSGHKMPTASVDVKGLREAKFSIGPVARTNKCMIDYPQFLGNLDLSKGFKLIMYSSQIMKIYEKPKEAHEAQNFLSKLELTASATSVSKAIDNWLQTCHGRSIVLISPSSELIKLTQMLIIMREARPSCCNLYSNKCWRHYIENVKMSLNSINEMYFDFKWKSRKSRAAHGGRGNRLLRG